MHKIKPKNMTLLTREEILDLFQCSISTLYKMRLDGMPVKRFSRRRIRYNYEEIMQWLSKRQDELSLPGSSQHAED